jgi:4-hydroxy-3-polyprenylbenzoate decarboxylase
LTAAEPRRLVVAITGATGAIYGVRLLGRLREIGGIETHLVVSAAGVLNAHQELGLKRGDVEALADVVHNVNDIGAPLASGSFRTIGMAIAPCSVRTLAACAAGLADNLITRAADVCFKERRRVVLMVR